MINLYEYECLSCDVVMQIQLSKTLDGGIGCFCGANLSMVFHTEIEESVFGKEENAE